MNKFIYILAIVYKSFNMVSMSGGSDKMSFANMIIWQPWPGCSKQTMSLVNVSLNFQKVISQTCQYFFVEKM